MCGILGVRRSWQPARERTEAALAALAWRGPDGSRLEDVGAWTIGVARLAITDAHAFQPITCPVTGRVVALNGAVTSARAEWPKYAGQNRTRNDAELLLLRLADRGESALGQMTGPHAFAVVDPRDGTLWLGRDPLGEKPLWVVRVRGRVVAFASTLTALRVLGVKVALGASERARLLRYGFCGDPAAAPPFELTSLEPGVWVEHAHAPLARIASASAVAGDLPFDAAFASAVARCADAEVRLGISLSGGIDSACIAVALKGRGLDAYQFRADGEPGCERARAEQVAALTGHTLRLVGGGPELLQSLPALTCAVGAPLGDPSVLAAAAVARAAARDGVRVLLSGEGADDLLLGYRRHRAAAWLPRHGFALLPPPPGLATGGTARMLRALRAEHPYDTLLEVAPPGFGALALGAPFATPGALPIENGESSLRRAQRIDRDLYLRLDLLPKLDAATMSAGVEGRCPFLDPAVLVATAHAAQDPRRVLGKRPLIAAFAHALPPGFCAQRKTGFAIPLDRWLREDDFLADLLMDARTLARPHVRAAGLRRALDLHRARRARLGHALYLLAALELHDRDTEAFEPCASSGS